jgi:hypothetical protein
MSSETRFWIAFVVAVILLVALAICITLHLVSSSTQGSGSNAEQNLEEVCANMRIKLLTTPESSLGSSDRANLERQVRNQCDERTTGA